MTIQQRTSHAPPPSHQFQPSNAHLPPIIPRESRKRIRNRTYACLKVEKVVSFQLVGSIAAVAPASPAPRLRVCKEAVMQVIFSGCAPRLSRGITFVACYDSVMRCAQLALRQQLLSSNVVRETLASSVQRWIHSRREYA